MTRYIVCRRDGARTLTILGVTEASGPNQAMRALGDTHGELTNHVAIPVRNWTEALVGEERQEPRAVVREVEPTFPGQTTLDEALAEDAPQGDSEPEPAPVAA